MITRRDFMKRTVYTGASILLAEQLISPLSSFALTGTGDKTDSGMDCLLDSLHDMIRNIPYDYSRCLGLIKLADLYAKCGRRQDGLEALSESLTAARVVKEHNQFEYASLLMDVADVYYCIGEQGVSHDVVLEAFGVLQHEFNNEYSHRIIVSTVKMLDKANERERALRWLEEETSSRIENSALLIQSAKAYLALGVDHRAKELAIEYSGRDDIINSMVAVRRLAEMAEGMADRGWTGKAYDLITGAVTLRNRLEKARQCGVARDISIVYAKLDEWEKAFDIADSARDENSYFRIACHAVKVGEMDIARRAAYPALINLKLSNERYLFELSSPEVAELFREMGDTQQAVRTINRSLDYMEGSSLSGYWRVQALSSSAVVFIKMDDTAEALKLLHKALESVSWEGDEGWKIDSLLRIAGVYVENQIPVGEEERAFVRTAMA